MRYFIEISHLSSRNWTFQIPSDLYAIVIGGGVSGLSTAATLAKAGKKVLVLEQSSYLGGGASTRQINGVNFDIGTYFVGQVRTKQYPQFNE